MEKDLVNENKWSSTVVVEKDNHTQITGLIYPGETQPSVFVLAISNELFNSL